MDWVSSASGFGGTGGGGGLGSENGPILYSEPNRTSAVDDIISVVIYIFIIAIFVSFFLILPGIRTEKFPTFLCITTSLVVTSIILIALFGTTWHVGDAPISAAYKAFSRDRIQGDLSVKIGLQSVNITLRAQKYYILHSSHGPIIMENSPPSSSFASSHSMATVHSLSSPATMISRQAVAVEAPPSSPLRETSDSINVELDSGDSPLLPAVDDSNGAAATGGGNLGDELLGERTSDGSAVDTELEVEEVFATQPDNDKQQQPPAQSSQQRRRAARNEANLVSPEASTSRRTRSSVSTLSESSSFSNTTNAIGDIDSSGQAGTSRQLKETKRRRSARSRSLQSAVPTSPAVAASTANSNGQRYTIKRVNVDINYNERFYWIEPNQMRQEHYKALERGLPYPILTVVEYLSQDEAGFSWSRQYRLAGYYAYITLWLSLCVCALMFFLHCAAPKYGIYAMQCLGCLLLFTNFTYATLVPRGEQKLVIPFEGQSLTFKFGWNFWLVLIGGCLSLVVGTLIVIIDGLFPNFIFTTILDVDFDSHNNYYKHHRRHKSNKSSLVVSSIDGRNSHLERPVKPPFFDDFTRTTLHAAGSLSTTSRLASPISSPASSMRSQSSLADQDLDGAQHLVNRQHRNGAGSGALGTSSSTSFLTNKIGDISSGSIAEEKKPPTQLSQLFAATTEISRRPGVSLVSPQQQTIDSEPAAGDTFEWRTQKKQAADSSAVVEMLQDNDDDEMISSDIGSSTFGLSKTARTARQHHYSGDNKKKSRQQQHQASADHKNVNLKSTDQRARATRYMQATNEAKMTTNADHLHQEHL